MPAAAGSSGGGGGAGDVRAGGAYYELSGKDKLSPALDKAESKVKKFSKAIKEHAIIEGGLGQIFEKAGQGGALGLGIALAQKGVEELGGSLHEWVTGAEAASKRFKEANEAATRAAEAQSKAIEEQLAAMRELVATSDKWAATLATPAERIKEVERRLGVVAGKLADLDRRARARGEAGPLEAAIGGELTREREALEKERLKLLDPLTHDEGFAARLNALAAEIEDTGPKLDGFQAKVADLFKTITKDSPAAAAEFERFMILAGGRDALDRLEAGRKALEDYVKEVRQTRAEVGLSPHEIQLRRAAELGVNTEDARRELLGGSGLGLAVSSFLVGLPALARLAAPQLAGITGQAAGGFLTQGQAFQQFGLSETGRKLDEALGIFRRLAKETGEAVADELKAK